MTTTPPTPPTKRRPGRPRTVVVEPGLVAPPPPKRGRPKSFTKRSELDPGIVIRTEGQRLLLEVVGTVKSIGATCGVSYQAVIDWRHGRTIPSPPARAALWSAYEIPAPAWGRLPVGVDAPVTPTTPTSSPDPVPAPVAPPAPVPEVEVNGQGHGPLVETSTLLAQIRRQLERTDLLANERARITDTYGKTLALQHRLQKEADMTEDRIVRDHPVWQRIRLELARVLARYPEVATEVTVALERLGM